MNFENETYRISGTAGVKTRSLAIGILGLIITGIGYFIQTEQFFFSYLTAYLFWVSIALGAFFLVLLFHLTGTMWGVVLRRILETFMKILPWMALLFIPILLGSHQLYHWTHADAVAHDAILAKKAGYLNLPFFTIRTVVYFVIWYLIARVLYKTSLEMDTDPTPERLKKLKKVSAPGMILFALTTTFASFDWIMSLYPHWYSTIFGLYFFSGGLVAALVLTIYFGIYLRKRNVLNEVVTIEHYHDLAKFVFGFIIFWAYMGFSQYLLIWYANIPEETIFYLNRWTGSWPVITMTIVLGHFLVPFVGLLPRRAKRNLTYLTFLSLFVLLMHYIDLFWLVMPTLHTETVVFSIFDLTALAGVGGIFWWAFWFYFDKHPLTPYGDPKFHESVKHHLL